MTTATSPRQILPAAAKWGHGLLEFIPNDYEHNGMCTECSLEVCVAAVENRVPSSQKMLGYTLAMQKLHDSNGNPLAAGNGAATLEHTAWYAQHVLGKAIAVQWNYGSPFPHDWLSLLRAYAGKQPILMQVLQGHNLIDAETKVRPEAAARGLQCHAIAIIGKQDDGYIVNDPDNLQVSQRFQIYTRQTLEAAVPCGLMMLAMPSPHAPTPPPKPTPPPVVHPIPAPTPDYRAVLAQIQAIAASTLKG